MSKKFDVKIGKKSCQKIFLKINFFSPKKLDCGQFKGTAYGETKKFPKLQKKMRLGLKKHGSEPFRT